MSTPTENRKQKTDNSAKPIAVAVVEHEDKFLIQQRPPGVPLAGLWEFPGGKVEVGESPEQAAVRECREETGLDVTIVGEFSEVDHTYDHDRIQLYFFACRPTQLPAANSTNSRWVTGSELHDYAFPPANAGLIAMLVARSAKSA